MTNKDIKKYADLYGWNTVATQLKNKYTFVSFCKNSVPTQGSITYYVNKVNEDANIIINKVILHKDNNITLVTSDGYIQFLN